MDRKQHWETVYGSKKIGAMSWTQSEPTQSLRIIQQVSPPPQSRILDAGGGASILVDRLLDLGYGRPEVLDLSGRALKVAQERLGVRADQVVWHEADVLNFQPEGFYDLWHDRAVFHFLTLPAERQAYREILRRSLRSGGHLVLAAFAPDGPDQCSNLPVQRWDSDLLRTEWGSSWKLISETEETHVTPWGKPQKFKYFLIQRD